MQAHKKIPFKISFAALLASFLLTTSTPLLAAESPFEQLAAQCAPDIHANTLKAIVSTESSWNPYAIGVVGGRLKQQPRTLSEAIATAQTLEQQGFNYSLGLGQINRANFSKQQETLETLFDPCRNLKASNAILKECYLRAHKKIKDEQAALRAALSCYYSGNFTRGFRADRQGQPSYVQKVIVNATAQEKSSPIVPAIQVREDEVAVIRPSSRISTTAKTNVSTQWVIFTEWTKPSHPSVIEQVSAQNERQTTHKQRTNVDHPISSFVQFTDEP